MQAVAQRRTPAGRVSCLARNGRSPGEESRPAALRLRRSRRSRPSARSGHKRGRMDSVRLNRVVSRRTGVHCQHRQGSPTVQVKGYPASTQRDHIRNPSTTTETMPPLLPLTGALLASPLQARRAAYLSLQGHDQASGNARSTPTSKTRGMAVALAGPQPWTYG